MAHLEPGRVTVGATMRVWYSPTYGATDVTFDTFLKAPAIAASLVADPVPGVEITAPEPVDRAMLCTVHEPIYVDAVLAGVPTELAASNELGWDPGLSAAVRSSSGGVRAAALRAWATGEHSGSLSSGLHHAHPGHGRGYCTINGLALAAEAVCAAGARRVLVLDLDAHCGGGTAAILARRAADAQGLIEQLDVSVDRFDEYTPHSTARLVLTDGDAYLDVIEAELAGLPRPDDIDLVLYNAGMDPHWRAGGVAGIDDEVLARREAMVFAWADATGLPVAWVLAGGYAHGVETAPGVEGIDLAGLVALHRLTVATAAVSMLSRGTRSAS